MSIPAPIHVVYSRRPPRLASDNAATDPQAFRHQATNEAMEARGYEAYRLCQELGIVDLGSWWSLTTEQQRPFVELGDLLIERERLAAERALPGHLEEVQSARELCEELENEARIYQEERDQALAAKAAAVAQLTAIETATGCRSLAKTLDELETVTETA